MRTIGPQLPEHAPGELLELTSLRQLARPLVREDEADDRVQESPISLLRRSPSTIRRMGSWLKPVLRLKAREVLKRGPATCLRAPGGRASRRCCRASGNRPAPVLAPNQAGG